jgi:hypothetical protein
MTQPLNPETCLPRVNLCRYSAVGAAVDAGGKTVITSNDTFASYQAAASAAVRLQVARGGGRLSAYLNSVYAMGGDLVGSCTIVEYAVVTHSFERRLVSTLEPEMRSPGFKMSCFKIHSTCATTTWVRSRERGAEHAAVVMRPTQNAPPRRRRRRYKSSSRSRRAKRRRRTDRWLPRRKSPGSRCTRSW